MPLLNLVTVKTTPEISKLQIISWFKINILELKAPSELDIQTF